MRRRPSPAVGDTIGGRYRLVRLLGEGGMGRVFLARRDDLDGQVAVKVPRADVELPANALERFRREAQSAMRLKSESVVRVLDMGTIDAETPFIVMERVVGKTLATHLAEGGPMDPSRAVDIVIDVCAVLAEAHVCGIVHRDIKASNVVLTTRPDGSELIKVLDFGIAKQTAADVSSLTETAAVLGSPKYMSPEQIRDARNVTALDDLWSLAVLLQEISTGGLPFEAFTVPGLFARIIADPPTPARSKRPDLAPELEAVLLKALAKDPSSRFRDAAELAEALAPFASAEGARRAARVRSIFAHAAADVARSEPPTILEPTHGAAALLELDVTSAPTELEPARRTSRAPSRTWRLLAVALGLAAVLVAGATWWSRPHASATSAAVGATIPPSGSVAISPMLAAGVALSRAETPLATASPISSTAESRADAPPPGSSSAPKVAAPSPPKVERAAARTSHRSTSGSSPAARQVVSDDDFGPRQ